MGHFCILGFGRTGISTAHYLRQQGHHLVVWDDQVARRNRAEQDGFTLFSQSFPWSQSTLIASPGVGKHPLIQEAGKNGCRVISDIQLFFEHFPDIQSIGVTGSNGKTTTCALIHHGLTQHGVPCVLAGNMGIPIFSTLVDGKAGLGIYILELSSYQLELSAPLPLDVAIILNLFPHHLDRHGTMAQYRFIKNTILKRAQRSWVPHHWLLPENHGPVSPYMVQAPRIPEIGASPDQLTHLLPENHGPVSPYMVQAPRIPEIGASPDQLTHHWSPSMVQGYTVPKGLDNTHSRDNMAAAIGALWSFGCTNRDAFINFKGLEHRQEELGCWHNIVYCNDSKATNPHAAALALQAYAGAPIYWIAGGVIEEDDLSILDHCAPHITHGFFIGQARHRYAAWLSTHHVPVTICDSLDQAVAWAHTMATQKDPGNSLKTVLLSPGCASLDQFQDFEHRGKVFKTCVMRHINPKKTSQENP
jgi:UDP-N-acetylmuramoylalanine--D-glutamate ligase